jgi:hypothetical protein
MTNWHVPPDVREAISAACKRYRAIRTKHQMPDINEMMLIMDLTACHANGCPMDWEKLLAADDFTFVHDLVGIANHIDRETGKIAQGFLPRCASKEVP